VEHKGSGIRRIPFLGVISHTSAVLAVSHFPAREERIIDPLRPQKSWRTAWRKLVGETAKRVGREAAQQALESGKGLRGAIAAWKRAAAPIRGLRFHDLRHQAITEMAEAGASDATLMAVAGHMSRRMLEHYSHVRMAAKRTALEKLESGLMRGALGNEPARIHPWRTVEESELRPYVTIHVTNSSLFLYLLEINGGRARTRTCDLLRVKQARAPNTMIIKTNIFARNFKLDTKSAFVAGRFGWVVLAPRLRHSR
jgi:hypothetical protein